MPPRENYTLSYHLFADDNNYNCKETDIDKMKGPSSILQLVHYVLCRFICAERIIVNAIPITGSINAKSITFSFRYTLSVAATNFSLIIKFSALSENVKTDYCQIKACALQIK